MLKIINAQGLVLQLASDQVVSGGKNNPLFDSQDSFFQDISIPGTAPFSELNKLFFQQGQLIESGNDYYLLPVTVEADGFSLSSGNIRYRIGLTGYEFNLEPNLTAINYLVANSYLTDVRTADADYSINQDNAAMNARMLDSVQNPDKYPYIFVPVYNAALDPAHSLMFINKFDYDHFVSEKNPGDINFRVYNTPFWKLTHILKQLISFMGFAPSGTFFTNDKYKYVLIYSQLAFDWGRIYPSMRYMPYILISDFFKFMRDRMHLSFDFDLVSGLCTVETFSSLKNSDDILDISPYVVEGVEQETPDQYGYKVTLKVDQGDDAWAVVDGDNTTYPPVSQIVAGDASTGIEMDIGTVRQGPASDIGYNYVTVNQNMLNPDSPGDGDFSLNDVGDPGSSNNWPLRLFEFTGFVALTDGSGGHFPTSATYDLNNDDLEFYKFQNDSKRLIITNNFPAAVLAGLRSTRKLAMRTEGLNYSYFIQEKFTYDIKVNSDLIPTKIYARTVNYPIVTPAALLPVQKGLSGETNRIAYKAYFNPQQNGPDHVDLMIKDYVRGTLVAIDTIHLSTTIKGTGGQVVQSLNSTHIDVRVMNGVPKYLIYLGLKVAFTPEANYYKATLPAIAVVDFDYVWIVF